MKNDETGVRWSHGHRRFFIHPSAFSLLSESVPDVGAKLKAPNTREKKFEDVVKEAEQAAVLVLVY